MADIIYNLRGYNTIQKLQKLMIGRWFFWFFRSRVCFHEESINVQHASIIVIKYYVAWNNNVCLETGDMEGLGSNRSHQISLPPRSIHWTPPPEGWLKLNFDGSKSGMEHNSFGFIIRKHLGLPVSVGDRKALLPHWSILMAEAMSFYMGLKTAISLGIRKLKVRRSW